ncbi:Ig-like domain-containing protein [Clostridium thailandense]|uniref:Ig-like domain-containing protein n=1 Tax=Clostridium thailandense TaxID=2794346 RepID=UPI0039896415
MKIIKNRVYLFLCAFLLCFCSLTNVKVQASSTTDNGNKFVQLPSQSDVSLNKKWTINFNSQATTDKIDAVVIQKDSQFIPVTVDMSDKSITVQPVNPYSENSQYTLKLFLSNGKKYSLSFTTEKISGTNPKVSSVQLDTMGNIYVNFDRPMSQQSAFVSSKWEINGRSLSDMGFKESDFGIKNNNMTIILNNLKSYFTVGTNVLYIDSSVVDTYGNGVEKDTRVSFEYALNTDNTKASMQNNSFKLSYFGNDIKAEFQFDKDLGQVNYSDFTVAGEQPDYAEFSGKTASLIFKADSKDSNGLNKVDVIKAQGVNALLSSIQSPTTQDSNGVTINYIAPVKVYQYLLAPKIVLDKCYATRGGSIVIKFDENIDSNSPIKTDDFFITGDYGSSLKVSKAEINSNTNELTLTCDMSDSNTAQSFTSNTSIDLRMASAVDIRGIKDQSGNYASYVSPNVKMSVTIK